MGQYQIVREEYYNKYGESSKARFYVKELKSFLFLWQRWVYITHEEWGWGDCHYQRTQFKSVFDAREFIKKVLCPNNKRDGMSSWVMEEHDCDSINKLEK
jgi:hypothetical protein